MQYAIYVASGRRVFADAMYKRTMPTLPVGLKAHGYLHYVHPVLQTLLILNYQFSIINFYPMTEEKKKNQTWEIVLKIIIAVASAIAGALGTAACTAKLLM